MDANKIKKGLGRGLSSLMGETSTEVVQIQNSTSEIKIPISKLKPSSIQPRRLFDKNSINELAESIKAKAIIVPTRRGKMANYVTNCHPQTPIICAFTNDSSTRRQLVLNRNVLSFRITFSEDPEKTLATAAKILMTRTEFLPEDRVVVISDALAGSGIDAIQIRQLSDLLVIDTE